MCASESAPPPPQSSSHIPNLWRAKYFPISFLNVKHTLNLDQMFSNFKELSILSNADKQRNFGMPFFSEKSPELLLGPLNWLLHSISKYIHLAIWRICERLRGAAVGEIDLGFGQVTRSCGRSLFLSREHFPHFTTQPITTCLSFASKEILSLHFFFTSGLQISQSKHYD